MHWPKVRVKGDVPGWTEKQKSGSPAVMEKVGRKHQSFSMGIFLSGERILSHPIEWRSSRQVPQSVIGGIFSLEF